MWTEAQYEEAGDRANDLRRGGQEEEARSVLEDALKQARAAGDEAMTAYFQGRQARREEDNERAEELLRRAAELKPQCVFVLRSMGSVLDDLGRHEEAIDWYDKALAIRPDDPRALTNRGSALDDLGRYDEAIESYDKALAIRPDYPLALLNRGVALDNLGRYDEAIESYDKALAIRPDYPRALLNRGVALAHLGRFNEAIEWFDKALAIRPDHALALRNRAVALGFVGKATDAIEALQAYIKTHPDDEVARTWLVRFSDAKEAQEEARELEEKRRKRDEERREAERRARDEKVKLDAWRSLSARSAHRIGNQLFASRGAIRTLKQATTGEAAEAADDLKGCLDRISTIVQEFRTFSANRPPQLKRGQVEPVVEDVARRYGNLAEGVSVDFDAARDLPLCLLDRSQMDQALGELLENAVTHVGESGRIAVTVQAVEAPGGRRVRVTIQDSGPGVPPQMKARLFQPFTSGRPGGSGLGLAIVKQIVDNHGGAIRETGEAGKGARFEIDLPAADDSEAHG